jgi:hypothetical protein
MSDQPLRHLFDSLILSNLKKLANFGAMLKTRPFPVGRFKQIPTF